jgi:hypothetical protein
MALFQQAVLNKYLKEIYDDEITGAWVRFTSHFHDPKIQENIRNAKEEEYQDGFLTDLFVNVLGYTKYPASGHNLKVELSLSQEAEWMEYFNEQKANADELKSQIAKTDREIDEMVYELYGLTGEEVRIVEDNSN